MSLRNWISLFLLGLALSNGPVLANPREDARRPEAAPQPKPFDFTEVELRARKLAGQPYAREDGDLPEFLAKLDGEHYREIQYKADKAIWRDEQLPFEMQLFHRGYLYRDRVAVNLVANGAVQPLAYSSDYFDFGHNQFPAAPPPTLGFAGVRFHYPMGKGAGREELAVFLGASYFRALGMGQSYGLSARGLAIDTGLAKSEEFPVFKEFWMEKPAPGAGHLTLYALLDSPSVTGAYRFVLRPGLITTVDVNSHLYFRQAVERLGIAPLTSMFFHGENSDRYIDDYRPEAHDSDGLAVARGSGEWTWRPLNNPRQLRISVFKETNPKGFGLMQRDRDFDHYQDLDARFQRRSSAWVEPLGEWGSGGIYLIEIPSDAQKYDNVAAFWVSDQPTAKGRERIANYRLHYMLENTLAPAGGRVMASRVGADGSAPGRRRFAVDFVGEELKYLSDDAQLEAELGASSGRLSDIAVVRNPATGGWRLSFLLEPEADKDVVDLRGYLKKGHQVLSETWLYQWSVK